jgi:hypothetical protein
VGSVTATARAGGDVQTCHRAGVSGLRGDARGGEILV